MVKEVAEYKEKRKKKKDEEEKKKKMETAGPATNAPELAKGSNPGTKGDASASTSTGAASSASPLPPSAVVAVG